MFKNKYLNLGVEEFIDLFFGITILSFLFAFSFYLFSSLDSTFISVYILFFLFISILLFFRLIFMKFVAYKNSFEIQMYQMYFNRFWINSWNKISEYQKGYKTKFNSNLKTPNGIPMTIISVIIYILSFGFFIYPVLFSYKIKKIPFLHLGTQQKFEYGVSYMLNVGISEYRYSKVLFFGFLYYLVFALWVEVFFKSFEFYYWLEFIIFWIAFINLIPIFKSEGNELFRKNNFAWLSIITILFFGFLSILVFNNIFYVILIAILSSVLTIFYLFWRKLM